MSDTILRDLYQVVLDRKTAPQEGSYTCYLFEQGVDKILKKVGEESAETIIAAKNGRQAVISELDRRSHKIGNLKQRKTVDRET